MQKAKQALKDLPFVRVLEVQLGYQDKKQSWFVSKWEDIKGSKFLEDHRDHNEFGEKIIGATFDEKGILISRENDPRKAMLYTSRYEQIREILRELDITDLTANLLYSLNLGTFLLLDATRKDASADLGQTHVES